MNGQDGKGAVKFHSAFRHNVSPSSPSWAETDSHGDAVRSVSAFCSHNSVFHLKKCEDQCLYQ